MPKPINEKYSYKDFTQQDLSNRSVSEFNNTRIIGTCFFQDFPKSRIFPSGMIGVEFELCNLDNVDIEAGNTVSEKSSNRQMQMQNDSEWWIVDDQDRPIEPVNISDGNTDPTKIPEKYYIEEEITKANWNETFGKGVIPENSRFRVIPTIEFSIDKDLTILLPKEEDWEPGMMTPWGIIPFEHLGIEAGIIKVPTQPGENPLNPTIIITYYKIRGEAWLYIGQKEGK